MTHHAKSPPPAPTLAARRLTRRLRRLASGSTTNSLALALGHQGLREANLEQQPGALRRAAEPKAFTAQRLELMSDDLFAGARNRLLM